MIGGAIKRPDGVMVPVLGLTHADVKKLISDEVWVAPAGVGLLLVCADSDETLSDAVRLAVAQLNGKPHGELQ